MGAGSGMCTTSLPPNEERREALEQAACGKRATCGRLRTLKQLETLTRTTLLTSLAWWIVSANQQSVEDGRRGQHNFFTDTRVVANRGGQTTTVPTNLGT